MIIVSLSAQAQNQLIQSFCRFVHSRIVYPVKKIPTLPKSYVQSVCEELSNVDFGGKCVVNTSRRVQSPLSRTLEEQIKGDSPRAASHKSVSLYCHPREALSCADLGVGHLKRYLCIEFESIGNEYINLGDSSPWIQPLPPNPRAT